LVAALASTVVAISKHFLCYLLYYLPSGQFKQFEVIISNKGFSDGHWIHWLEVAKGFSSEHSTIVEGLVLLILS
jgi:hypothetical protein